MKAGGILDGDGAWGAFCRRPNVKVVGGDEAKAVATGDLGVGTLLCPKVNCFGVCTLESDGLLRRAGEGNDEAVAVGRS